MSHALPRRSSVLNPYVLLSAFLLFAQQLCVGAMVYCMSLWASSLDQSIVNRPLALTILLLSMGSYFLGGFSRALLDIAIASAWKNYCRLIFGMVSGRIQWANPKNRALISTRLGPEALQTFDNYLTSAWNFLSLGLNLLLTFFPMLYFLGSPVAFSLGVPMVCSISFFSLFKKKLQKLTTLTQVQKQNILIRLPSEWDHQLFWSDGKKVESAESLQILMSQHGALVQQRSFLEQFVGICPIVIGLTLLAGSLFFRPTLSAGDIGSLCVNFPRIVQWLQNCNALTGCAIYFWLQHSKLDRIFGVCDELHYSEPRSRVLEEKIRITDQTSGKSLSFTELFEILTHASNGRITLRGGNGAGKSSLLLWIKQCYPDALLIQPHAASMPTEVGSSGEIMWKKLSEAVSDLPKLLLLDEWDANLDAERVDKMNAEIRQLSQSILIVEVRHR